VFLFSPDPVYIKNIVGGRKGKEGEKEEPRQLRVLYISVGHSHSLQTALQNPAHLKEFAWIFLQG